MLAAVSLGAVLSGIVVVCILLLGLVYGASIKSKPRSVHQV